MKPGLAILIATILSFSPYATGNNMLHMQAAAQTKAASPKDIVTFNTKSLKYHNPQCLYAKRCTVNCIPTSRAYAKERGGVPCKVCNGGE